MPEAPQQNLQPVEFIIETTATIINLELYQGAGSRSLTVTNGQASEDLAPGASCVAELTLAGPVGTKAKFRVVQVIGGVRVPLAERKFIKITSATGRTVANVDFIVR